MGRLLLHYIAQKQALRGSATVYTDVHLQAMLTVLQKLSPKEKHGCFSLGTILAASQSYRRYDLQAMLTVFVRKLSVSRKHGSFLETPILAALGYTCSPEPRLRAYSVRDCRGERSENTPQVWS